MQALLVPLLLHHFGRETYGLYATLTSLAGYFALLTFGSALTVPRFVSEHAARGDREGLSAFVSTYFVAHFFVAAAGLALATAVAPALSSVLRVPAALRGEIIPAWGIVMAGWALGLIGGLCQSFLTGLGDVALANVVNSIRTVMTLLAAAIAIVLDAGLPGTLAALSAASLAGSILAIVMVRAKHPDIRIAPALASRSLLAATLRPASWYFLMQVAAIVVTGTDNMIIGAVLGVDQVAGYAVAFQLWALALAVLWSGVDAIQPFITRWDVQGEREQLRATYLAATRFTFLGALAFALVLSLLGPGLIRLWTDGAVAVDRRVLFVFAGMLLTATPIHTAALVLAGLGKHKPVALGGATEAVLNVVLSLILVRSYGVLGVALGTLVSGMLTNFWIAPMTANRELGIRFPDYLRSMVPSTRIV